MTLILLTIPSDKIPCSSFRAIMIYFSCFYLKQKKIWRARAFPLLISAKKKSTPNSPHKGQQDCKRDCDYVTVIRPTTTIGVSRQKELFAEKVRGLQASTQGVQIPPGYRKFPSAGVQ